MNQLVIVTQEPRDSVSDEPALNAVQLLIKGRDLEQNQARALFAAIVDGRLPDASMAAAFVALRLKGETADELTGAALALREAAVPFPSPKYLFADSCGTGGDYSGSINVSTAAGLVAAACGLPVAKHGNRGFTSQCGSADVLEALGARLDLPPARSRKVLDETRFCFLLAPQFHPGIAHAGPVRRALKERTVMNLLGPCLNPARPKVQLLGVADPKLLRPIAETLAALGVGRALVVHGSGLDEIALHGFTQAILLSDGEFEELELIPEQAGLRRQPADHIAGGSPGENARRLAALVAGRGREADESVVALNAGGLLMTAGRAAKFRVGVAMALDAIRSGAAARLLADFVEATHG